jgi:hypothetical protein
VPDGIGDALVGSDGTGLSEFTRSKLIPLNWPVDGIPDFERTGVVGGCIIKNDQATYLAMLGMGVPTNPGEEEAIRNRIIESARDPSFQASSTVVTGSGTLNNYMHREVISTRPPFGEVNEAKYFFKYARDVNGSTSYESIPFPSDGSGLSDIDCDGTPDLWDEFPGYPARNAVHPYRRRTEDLQDAEEVLDEIVTYACATSTQGGVEIHHRYSSLPLFLAGGVPEFSYVLEPGTSDPFPCSSSTLMTPFGIALPTINFQPIDPNIINPSSCNVVLCPPVNLGYEFDPSAEVDEQIEDILHNIANARTMEGDLYLQSVTEILNEFRNGANADPSNGQYPAIIERNCLSHDFDVKACELALFASDRAPSNANEANACAIRDWQINIPKCIAQIGGNAVEGITEKLPKVVVGTLLDGVRGISTNITTAGIITDSTSAQGFGTGLATIVKNIVYDMWQAVVQISNIVIGLLFLIIALATILDFKVFDSYTIKQNIGPFLWGVVFIQLSYLLVGALYDGVILSTNWIAETIMTQGGSGSAVDINSPFDVLTYLAANLITLNSVINQFLFQGLGLIILIPSMIFGTVLVLSLIVVALVVALFLFAVQAIGLLLIVISPVLGLLYILPSTRSLFGAIWKLATAMFLIQLSLVILLAVAFRMSEMPFHLSFYTNATSDIISSYVPGSATNPTGATGNLLTQDAMLSLLKTGAVAFPIVLIVFALSFAFLFAGPAFSSKFIASAGAALGTVGLKPIGNALNYASQAGSVGQNQANTAAYLSGVKRVGSSLASIKDRVPTSPPSFADMRKEDREKSAVGAVGSALSSAVGWRYGGSTARALVGQGVNAARLPLDVAAIGPARLIHGKGSRQVADAQRAVGRRVERLKNAGGEILGSVPFAEKAAEKWDTQGWPYRSMRRAHLDKERRAAARTARNFLLPPNVRREAQAMEARGDVQRQEELFEDFITNVHAKPTDEDYRNFARADGGEKKRLNQNYLDGIMAKLRVYNEDGDEEGAKKFMDLMKSRFEVYDQELLSAVHAAKGDAEQSVKNMKARFMSKPNLMTMPLADVKLGDQNISEIGRAVFAGKTMQDSVLEEMQGKGANAYSGGVNSMIKFSVGSKGEGSSTSHKGAVKTVRTTLDDRSNRVEAVELPEHLSVHTAGMAPKQFASEAALKNGGTAIDPAVEQAARDFSRQLNDNLMRNIRNIAPESLSKEELRDEANALQAMLTDYRTYIGGLNDLKQKAWNEGAAEDLATAVSGLSNYNARDPDVRKKAQADARKATNAIGMAVRAISSTEQENRSSADLSQLNIRNLK